MSEGDPKCIYFTPDTYQEFLKVTFCETGVSFRTDGRTEDGGRTEIQTDVEAEIAI